MVVDVCFCLCVCVYRRCAFQVPVFVRRTNTKGVFVSLQLVVLVDVCPVLLSEYVWEGSSMCERPRNDFPTVFSLHRD